MRGWEWIRRTHCSEMVSTRKLGVNNIEKNEIGKCGELRDREWN
jgi:hypothetical protein